MAKLLPPQISIPGVISRQHTPKPGDYGTYRPCLRLEFSFACAFCLCHEADLIEQGAEGTGLFWIEHFEPQKSAPELKDVYTNCFYVCRFCNRARGGARTVDANGVRLLNPSTDAWNAHFTLSNDRIEPVQGDARALRTEKVYRINVDRKVVSRSHRRTLIEGHTKLIEGAPHRISGLKRALANLSGDALTDQEAIWGAIIALQKDVVRARKDLERYADPPIDRPEFCRCPQVDSSLSSQ